MEDQITLKKNDIIFSKIKDLDKESNELLTNTIFDMIDNIPELVRNNFDIDIIAHTGKVEINFEQNILTKGSSEIHIHLKNLNREE